MIMKKYLFFVMTLGFAASAQAAEIDLGHIPLGDREEVKGTEYGYSRELGRAWLIVNTQDDSACAGDNCTSDGNKWDIKVPGLALKSNDIVIDGVVCARVKRNSFGPIDWWTVETTGACRIRFEAGEEVYDNGFGRREVHKIAKISFAY